MAEILAIDEGTTSGRAILFGGDMRPRALAQREFPQHFPRPGWVEHDPEDIWAVTVGTCREVLGAGDTVAAIGITNQRETTLVWDAETGRPLTNAIVWQDRRTAPDCEKLRAEGLEPMVRDRTGLLLDPYFSATKISWILDHVEGARRAAEAGRLRFGTVDSFLIWRLTGGRVHATDATNAARTMLYDIRRNAWDEELCALFRVPLSMLPEVRDSADDFGTTEPEVLGKALPIRGVAGDQQAAMLGQACFERGMMKSTYGTGCFALLNTGESAVPSANRLLTTIAYRIAGRTHYALEGSIFIAGAVVQWLRDRLGLIREAAECDALAAAADPEEEVDFVPAFTGLGAPWWDPDARGAIMGLTRKVGREEIVRAALESVGLQTADLMAAMEADCAAAGIPPGAGVLRVDGGMTASDWTMQFLADVLACPVDRPVVRETTALGAAWLAGMGAGVWPDMEGFAARWELERRFTPARSVEWREARRTRWKRAVACVLSRSEG